jgi:hypothetical protein
MVSQLGLEKLEIKFLPGVDSTRPIANRRYTLTHSDFSGDLFLSIGLEFDKQAISGLYTRIMRDEILAEWLKQEEFFTSCILSCQWRNYTGYCWLALFNF